jgi:hypothetical protein
MLEGTARQQKCGLYCFFNADRCELDLSLRFFLRFSREVGESFKAPLALSQHDLDKLSDDY